MLTTHQAQEKRRRANRGRADGYLLKNTLDRETFQDALERHGYLEDSRPIGDRLVGRSFALLAVLREARRYALQYGMNPNTGSRIIYGETGSGKTELARYIHGFSRRTGHYVKWTAEEQNEGMAKDALFGHWKGAHSEAKTSAPGEIEKAHRGTFFVDEISNMSPT